ncbi:uncharacterized protein LOC117169812 [Belonocnema kinseyi]|uniref:uncharacterized protein LOC117169812 n=1 Tax=Belonocnema kinseyi TaxID=2817044 RepID=UPI00143DE2B9|nr:uncharacterized protein LOC117169812 [Belonocnema kinseyi]
MVLLDGPDNIKLPLYEDGTVLPGNTAQITRVKVIDKDQDIYIENDKLIPDGVYKVENEELVVPLYNYDKDPLIIPQQIEYEAIEQIKETNRMSATLVEKKPTFDLSSGFHQIPMSETSKKYTAFSTPEGYFEFNRMPFGLKNSPATFQRMMDNALRGLVGKKCFVYLDDIVVFGSTLEEHNENLVSLFDRLRETGLKLQPDKCEYLRPEFKYLGHLLTEDGVKPNPAKIQAVRDFKPPQNVTQVQSFLGLAGEGTFSNSLGMQKVKTVPSWKKVYNSNGPSGINMATQREKSLFTIVKMEITFGGTCYTVEHVKGKENKAADCLSRLFPIQQEEGSLQNTPEEVGQDVERGEELIGEETASTSREENVLPQPTPSREHVKPNAGGKLWRTISKERRGSHATSLYKLPQFNETEWLKVLDKINKDVMACKLSISRYHFIDPMITSLEKVKIRDYLNFLSHKYEDQQFHTCYIPRAELTQEEKGEIIRESHGSITAQHFGENKTIERARTLGEWKNMEQEIIHFIKRCPVCQLQKTVRIERLYEAIIPDTPGNPNDKIAMDIFGTLPSTLLEHAYILSIQDMLTKYLILIPLKHTESESIIEGTIIQNGIKT